MEKNFVNVLLGALLHSIMTILVFIFLLPYKLWVKSAKNLLAQKERNAIDPENIEGFWPFLTYLKRFTFDFWFDACSFLSYFIGVLAALISFFFMVGNGFGLALASFFVTLVSAYFTPIFVSLSRDFFQILLIPFRKFLNWGSKPAQYLEIKNK